MKPTIQPFQPNNTDSAITDVLSDPSTSFWLKNNLELMLRRDCLDACSDAQILYTLLKNRADAILVKSVAGMAVSASAQ